MMVAHIGEGSERGPIPMRELFRRKLPGYCLRDQNNEVVFIRGRVIHSGWGRLGPSTQAIETDSKLVGLVHLVGHNYIYWCESCKLTIFEQEIMLTRQVRSSDIARQRCVFCEGPMLPVQRGQKVRLHYRWAKNGMHGGWWAEVWEW